MNKEKVKELVKLTVIYTGVIVLIGAVTFWLWKNPIYNPAGPVIQATTSEIEVRFSDVIVKGRKEGVPHWTVYSKNVDVERNSPMVYFKDKPNGEFYNLKDWSENTKLDPETQTETTADKLRAFQWQAERAEYNTENENLKLIKDVNITTDKKDTIVTEELFWSNSEQKATSETRTTIIGNGGHPVIKSDNVEADVKFDTLNLKGQVEITTELTDEQQL